MTYRDPRYAHIEKRPHVVYVYWRHEAPLYVGMTCDVERRIREHERNQWMRDHTHIDIWQLDCPRAEAEAIESAAIASLQPRDNRRGKYDPESALSYWPYGPITKQEHDEAWARWRRAVDAIPVV